MSTLNVVIVSFSVNELTLIKILIKTTLLLQVIVVVIPSALAE